MIFLTVGTHEPFDRLVRGVDEWCASRNCGNRVFGQITPRASYHPQYFEWTETLSPMEFEQHIRQCTYIVSHAGMGTIISAMSMLKPILVLPRRGHLSETRNDHQYATIGHFGDRQGILIAKSDDELFTSLDQLVNDAHAPAASINPYADETLIQALRDFIHE